MDETYRRFHSGRFGPAERINPDFATKVQSGKGFTNPDTSPMAAKQGKDKEGNTYTDQATADMFDEQSKFMKD